MSNKKGFTLLELVIATALFGIGLIGVFVVLSSGFRSMAQARGQVEAINLAREGAEMMFNLRDTNLLKWSGKKDQCWLNRKGIFAANNEQCEEEQRMGFQSYASGVQYVPMMATYGATKTPILIPFTGTYKLNLNDGISVADTGFELMITGSGEFLPHFFFSGSRGPTGCKPPNTSGELTNTTSGCNPIVYSNAGRFYRTINNVALFDKTATTTGGREMNCAKGSATDTITGAPCGTEGAKELRFCSEVQYIVDKARRTVTMCSLMTPFSE